MSLLQKAIEIREREDPGHHGLNRAPETGGLLDRTLRLVTGGETETASGNGDGLLARATRMLESSGRREKSGPEAAPQAQTPPPAPEELQAPAPAAGGGLLERAARYLERPSGERASLYERAARERARLEAGPAPEEPEAVPEEDRRYHREVMERILQEPAAPPREPVPEEEAEQEPPVPAGGDIDMLREVESLGGEIEQAGPAPPEEAQVPGGPGVSRRPAPQEIPPSAEEPGYPGEPAVAEHAEAPGEALVPERIAEQVRDYLAGGRTVDLVNLFFSVQQREGHERFTALLAEAFTGIGQGTGTLLFTAHRDRYELECRHDAGEEPVPWRKRSFRKKSALARCLREQGRVLSSDEELGREVEKELSSFEAFQPYAAVPVQVGEELVGFALVAGLREAVPAHQLLLLANTAALNLYSFVLEKNLQESLDRLLEENRELHSIMDLYRYGELGSMSLDDVLAAAAGNFGIESAVITGNWDGKGSVTVLASLGLSEKGIKKYRVAKSDKELKGVIRKGDPAVLGGMDERLSRLPEQDRQGMNTFIAAPVLFDGRTLAVLMIHRMKGVNRHLSSRQAALVRNIAQSLTPFLLYRRMVEMEPLEVFEALLEREAAEARKTRVPLHVTAFRIKNYKAIITSQGFTTYRQRLDRFCSRISKAAGAAAHVVALNKVVLLIRDSDQERVNQTIKKVKDAVRAMAGKEKAKLPLSYTPMRTVFPNDSKSVADIMQVIE